MLTSQRTPHCLFLLFALSGCAFEDGAPRTEPTKRAGRAGDRSADRPAEGAPELTPRMIAGVGTDEIRDGDLRPETLELLEAADRGELEAYEARRDTSSGHLAHLRVPDELRVWRRSLGGPQDSSCAAARQGYVETIPIEEYVKGVLPHEWIRSWAHESLKAGAVIIRTYASYHALQGGKYNCADLDDTIASQVYRDERYEVTDRAVEETAGMYIVDESIDRLRFTEYSAENGDPTEDGVSEPHCTGEERFGHGRGACQWGTARWAYRSGKGFVWIARHYFPGSLVVKLRYRDSSETTDKTHEHEVVQGAESVEGGCSAAGGASGSAYVLLAVLIGLPALRRRQRS